MFSFPYLKERNVFENYKKVGEIKLLEADKSESDDSY
jgi:hypothetical protein